MPEIKVECSCGQRFKFDVEPVNGRIPFTVACPVCGRDGTSKANEILAQFSGPPRPLTQRVAAPVGVLLSDVPATTAAPVPSPVASGLVPRPMAAPARAKIDANPALPCHQPSFGLGLLGAAVGALIGSLLYFLLFNYTGIKLKLIAVGVGYLAGMGAEWLGRKEGSKELGMLAATFTLIGLVGAQYFVTHNWWASSSREDASAYFADSVTEAKEVVKAIPNGTDEEIRLYLASQEAEEGEKPDVEAVPAEMVQEFKTNTLPEMRDLASGEVSQADFERQEHLTGASQPFNEDEQAGEDTFKAFFLLFLLSKFNLFSMAAAAGLAFKLCSNA